MEIDGPNPLPSIPQTCVVCGLAGPKSCGACKAVQYCSKDHQTLHWTKGRHKLVCGNLTTSADDIRKDEQALRQLLFPEHELVSEDEPGPEALKDDAFVQALSDTVGLGQLVENDETFPDEEVAEDSEVDVDRTFLKFQKRLSREPEQVLRYARVSYSSEEANPQPLWANDGDRPDPEADIGCCPQCNAQRTFELQVMPQLLNSLDIVHSDPDAMDWGTLLVYSCNANCTPAQGFYQREVIWRQMFADQGMNLRLPPEAMETK